MTTDSAPRIKITYATLSADNEELHAGFEAAVAKAKTRLGGHYKNYIDGEWRDGDGTFEARSPIDRELLLGTFATGTTADLDAAVAAARAAQPAWAAVPWRERLAIVRRAAEHISDHLMDYAADMAIEVGKNRIEALGEVEESADLLRYYAQTMEDNDGYDHPMGNLGDATVHTRSVLRPHGVFAVISPFNFPMALATGPTGAALIAGNTVVLKPSSASPLSSQNLMQAYIEAGLPKGAVNLVMGPGDTIGQALQDHPGIDGIVFTGSYEVGMRLFHSFSKAWPRPCIVEMGGKNPAIVSRKADLDEAAEGIMRSAFGFGGQKCSANSRVYVERPVHDELVRLLVEKTEKVTLGDPLVRANWMGPIIDQRAVDRHQAAVSEARRDGTVFTGGEHLTDGDLATGLLRRADGRRRAAVVTSAVPRRAVRPVHRGGRRRFARRGDLAGQRQRAGPDGRRLQRGSGRGPAVPRHDRGGRDLREPARRRDDRRLARDPGVRRLEGQRLDRQGRPLDVLRSPVHARAEPHHRRLASRGRRGTRATALRAHAPSGALARCSARLRRHRPARSRFDECLA